MLQMVLVPAHSVNTAPNSPNSAESWIGLHDPAEAALLTQHISTGVAMAAASPSSWLVFSGGDTNAAAGSLSEGESYRRVAQGANWWGCPGVEHRSLVEGHARDSRDNLVYALATFYRHVGQYPDLIIVVGWAFKRPRFLKHCDALEWPAARFCYIGLNDPPRGPMLDAALTGEARKRAAMQADPLLLGADWARQRTDRNPHNTQEPYSGWAPNLAAYVKYLNGVGQPVTPPWAEVKGRVLRRLWRVAYSAPPSVLRRGAAAGDDRAPNLTPVMSSLHMLRDGESLHNLSDILSTTLELKGTLLNLPPGVFGVPVSDGDSLVPLGAPAPAPLLDRSDLLVQATRFPKDDDALFDKSAVLKSGSRIEQRIEAGIVDMFKHCSRDVIVLSDAVAAACDEQGLRYRAVQFSVRRDIRTGRQAGMAVRAGNIDSLLHLNRCKEVSGPSTFGYLIFLSNIAPNGSGPAFLNAFGLHGTGTLLWSALLKDMFAARVQSIVRSDRPRLLVCRFQPTFDPTFRPSHLSVTTTEPPEIVIDVAL